MIQSMTHALRIARTYPDMSVDEIISEITMTRAIEAQ